MNNLNENFKFYNDEVDIIIKDVIESIIKDERFFNKNNDNFINIIKRENILIEEVISYYINYLNKNNLRNIIEIKAICLFNTLRIVLKEEFFDFIKFLNKTYYDLFGIIPYYEKYDNKFYVEDNYLNLFLVIMILYLEHNIVYYDKKTINYNKKRKIKTSTCYLLEKN